MRICGLRFSKAVHTRAKAAVGHHKRARARGYAARRGRPRRAPQPDVMDASSAGKSRDLCVARWRRLLPPRQGLSQTAGLEQCHGSVTEQHTQLFAFAPLSQLRLCLSQRRVLGWRRAHQSTSVQACMRVVKPTCCTSLWPRHCSFIHSSHPPGTWMDSSGNPPRGP